MSAAKSTHTSVRRWHTIVHFVCDRRACTGDMMHAAVCGLHHGHRGAVLLLRPDVIDESNESLLRRALERIRQAVSVNMTKFWQILFFARCNHLFGDAVDAVDEIVHLFDILLTAQSGTEVGDKLLRSEFFEHLGYLAVDAFK